MRKIFNVQGTNDSHQEARTPAAARGTSAGKVPRPRQRARTAAAPPWAQDTRDGAHCHLPFPLTCPGADALLPADSIHPQVLQRPRRQRRLPKPVPAAVLQASADPIVQKCLFSNLKPSAI